MVDISDEILPTIGNTVKNIDWHTLSMIEKMEYGKARTAGIIDPETGKDTANQVKRTLSTLASSIGRKLKYYNRKDFPNQIPEGRVGFEVTAINTSTPEVQAVLEQLNAWRAAQETNGQEPGSPPVVDETPPDGQEGTPEGQQTTSGRRR